MCAADSLHPSYVLHSRRFSESSLLVDCFTQQHGRATLLAKGALNSKSGRQALLQPFMPLMIAWRGRGETPILTQVEAAGSAYPLKGKRLYCGMYLNELLLYLLPKLEPQSIVFAHYVASLLALSESDVMNVHLEPILRRFELQLLAELGMGLSLTHDHLGHPIQATAYYHYQVQEGALPCDANYQAALQGATLLGLASDEVLSDQQRKEARWLMRYVLNVYLQGRELKSRELFL